MVYVANRVREEETAAAAVIAAILGVPPPTPADVNGEVDLLFTASDGARAAAEVTFLTDMDIKLTNARWMRERKREYKASTLANSWRVVVHADRAEPRFLPRLLEPSLAVLERYGVDELDAANFFAATEPDLMRAVGDMFTAGVAYALVVKAKDPNLRRIFVTQMNGYTASGGNAALEIIEEYVRARIDNHAKLAAAGVEQRHLFLWLDTDTPGEVAAPFTSGPASKLDHFGLPSRPPDLPDEITHLWIVHRRTGRGWRWSPDVGWNEVVTPAA